MPLLNDADEVYRGAVRVDRVYAGDTMVWPKVETWSPWYMVGAVGPIAAPSAWFATGITNYDSGGHEQVRFRYSNLGRVHWRGIMRNATGADMGAGFAIIGCNINDPNVPKPLEDLRMMTGPSGVATANVWTGGGPARFDARPYDYHHLIVVATTTAAPIPNGSWFAIDGIYAFSADT